VIPEIRILNQDDAGELFRLRRSALLDSPLAFTASPEDDAASSQAAVRELLKPRLESVVFGAFTPGLIGMLGLQRPQQRKTAHKVNLWGMFVLPASRGQGVAAQLLDAAIRYARTFDGVTSVHLSVTESALAARRVYEKAGFETWGVEPDAIRFEGRSESERRMRVVIGLPRHRK
jgi:RimJ/RimL family protein N-acetyltransferase